MSEAICLISFSVIGEVVYDKEELSMQEKKKNFLLIYALGIVIVIILAAIMLVTSRENRQEPRESLTIGIGTWAGFATGIVGKEQNLFQGINVDTKILDDNTARHSALQSGDIDIMISSVDVFAQEAAQGIKGDVILVTDESWGGDGIVVTKKIKKPEELKGKKVAYARGTPSHYLIHKILIKHNLSLNDIEHIQVDDPGRAGDVFLSGDVDAAVTWEPFLSKIAESGKGHVLATTKDYPEIIVDVLIASRGISKDNETLKHFIDGWMKSVEFIESYPDEAAAIMAKGLSIPTEDIQGMMLGLKYADRERNGHFFSSPKPNSTRLAELLDQAGSYWESVGIVKEPVPGATRVSGVACEYFSSE